MKSQFERYDQELKNLHNNSCARKLCALNKTGKYIFENNSVLYGATSKSFSQDCSCSTNPLSNSLETVGRMKYLNLSSNDYLGIAQNQEISKKFLESGDFSFGATSSRLLTGGCYACSRLETFLSGLLKKEKALIFNSGYHANVGIMSALLSKKDAVFSDKLNHASIIDGIRLSESKMFRYKHLDYNHLESLLNKHRDEYDNAIIVTESLFSMDGDIADLKRLVELKKKYNALLVVDEAHAFGVFGAKGIGVTEVQDCLDDVDIFVATFGKAVGSVGAFCAGPKVLIDYLINKSRPLIFSTALPEINIAFSFYVLSEIIPNLKRERNELIDTSKKLRENLLEYGLQTMGESHIVPVILGDNETAVRVSSELLKNGYYLLPIRHPTVAKGSSRVRISLRADISYDDIADVAKIVKKAIG